jgi:PAS domain S-box-containing protein
VPSKNRNSTAEDNLTAILNLIADPAIIIGKDGKFRATNQVFNKVTSVGPHELVGKSFLEVDFLQQNKAVLAQNFAKRLHGLEIEPYAIKVTLRSGEERYFEPRGKKVEFNGESVDVVIFYDVTNKKKTEQKLEYRIIKNVEKRKEVEQALKDSEEKYRKLFEESTDAIFVADARTGLIIDCNRAASELVGWECAELIGKHQSMLHPKETIEDGFSRSFRKLVEGKNNIVETHIVTKKGEIKQVTVRANYIDISGKRVIRGTFRDTTELKKSEEALNKKTQLSQILLDAFPCVALLLRPSTREIVASNRAAVKVGAVPGKKCFSTWGQRASPCPWCLAPNLWKTQKAQHLEVEALGIVWDAHWIPISEDLYMHFAFDITERKHAELKLKRQKDFEERIIDSLSDPLMVIDPVNFEILHANEAALKQTKLELKDLVGKTCHEATHHESKPCFMSNHECPIQKCLKVGKKIMIEHAHFDKKTGKEYVEVSVNPAVTPEGKTVMIHVAKNVTERKRMLEALRDSEETFRTISNAAKDALILVDDQGKIRYWNPSAERIFGHSMGEVLDKEAHSVIAGQTSRSEKGWITAVFKNFVQTGQSAVVGQAIELTAKRKDGTQFPLELSVSAISLKGKWHAVALARDITEQKQIRKKLEEYSEGLEFTVAARTQELVEANERLVKAERFSAIGELAGMIGHDLRNPLTGIKNAAYYLRRKQGCLDEAKGAEMLKIIDSSVDHANRIISDLLEYSREIHLELEECSPRSLLDYALLLVKIPDHIKVVDRTLDQPMIWVDTNKMERVFINLIKNAIDAMPEKGTLEFSSHPVGDNVEFVFSDSGIGMTEKTLSKLFMPLFTTKAQGMGFGLAICKRIVEAHGGKITVESSVGRGTSFKVILPVEQKLRAGYEETWLVSQDSLESARELQENK